jgi:hypothetical protein
MQKVPDRYKGILYFLLGGFFLFLAMQMSGKNASPSTVGDASSSTNPKIPFFLIGMAIPALLFFILKRRSTTTKDQEESKASSDEYATLIEKARNAWSLIRKNNRLYLGALVVSYGADKFGVISGHPLFGHPLVIAFVYALAFLACVQQMIKGKKLEDQVALYSIQGINLEKRTRKIGYFHKIGQESQGYETFILLFFRILIPAWLVYCAIDFAMTASKNISPSIVMTTLISMPFLAAIFLWYFGCRPSFLLSQKLKQETA